MKSWLLLLLIGLSTAITLAAESPAGSLRGTITDRRTGEPLVGASVLLVGTSTGSATDFDGRFRIASIPTGIYTVRVQSVGYEAVNLTDIVIRSQRETELNATLTPSVVTGQEVVVTGGSYFQIDPANPISAVSFNPEELRRSPGSGQELARVISLIPGVVAKGEVSQDLMVRGGSPAENGFFIDNIPMPGVAHFQQPGGQTNGPIGIVNTDLIEDVTFFTGGYSAAYGDRASAIGDVRYREGARNRYAGDMALSLSGAGLTLEGPILDGKGSVLVSGRRSYLDLIADAIAAGGAPSYSDAQIKAVWDVNRKHRLTFLNIFGSSRFTADEDQARDAGVNVTTDARYSQNTIGLNHRFVWSKTGFTNTSVSYSWKTDRTISEYYDTGLAEADIRIRNAYVALRSVSRYSLNPRLSVDFGVDARLERGEYNYFVAGGIANGGAVRPDITRDLSLDGTVAGAFATLTLNPVNAFNLSAGLRADHSDYNDATTVDPRVSATYALSPSWSLNAAWGWYSQLSDRFLMSQYAANRDLKAMRARHLMFGVDHLLTDDTKVTFEVFDKRYRDMPELPAATTGYAPLFVPDNGFLLYETPLRSTGTAWARGAEMFIQKKLAVDFYGMASVAWFRTRYEGFDGVEYNRDFDTKFQTSLIGGWRPNDRFEISARWSYVGSRPFTPIDADASRESDFTVLDLSRINGARMPAYHSLYLRADRRYFLNRTNVVTFIELWNTYARENVSGYFWSPVDDKVVALNQFGFIPVGGVKFEF